MWQIWFHRLLQFFYQNATVNKKTEHIARETARCVIHQFLQSTLFFGTARPSESNLQFTRVIIYMYSSYFSNMENRQNSVYMYTGTRKSKENLHKNLRNPANIRINVTSPESRVHAEHFCFWRCDGSAFIIFNAIVLKNPNKSRCTCAKQNLT